MQKLITYLKNGKGRGLLAMLVFSVLATLLSWGMNYSTLEQIPYMNPSFSASYLWGLHLGFVLSGFVAIWLLYIIVVGISVLLSKIFRLNLTKGTIWRSTTVSLIALFLVSALLALIAFILSLFGQLAALFYPIIIMVVVPLLLVMLIAFALAEPKEGKKKK